MFKQLPIRFIYLLLIGIGLGLILGFKSYIPFAYWNEEYSWARYALPNIINYSVWPFFVPIIYFVLGTFPFKESSTYKLIIILSSLVIAFTHEAITNVIFFGLLDLADWYPFTDEVWMQIKGNFLSAMITRLAEYWIIYGLLAAYDFYKKYQIKAIELAQLETKLTNARLNALKMQLQPHFLFNTLNTISSLMEINVKSAQKTISKLGDLLRTILTSEPKQMITIMEELDYIKSYLDIEQTRFHDRLQVDYQVDEKAKSAMVPTMILQPLVENAVKHGFSKISGEGVIIIAAKILDEAMLEIFVRDDGRGSALNSEKLRQKGIGLRNVEERLNQLYNGDYQFTITTSINSGFEVKIRLPLKYYHEKDTHTGY
ncbi:histidine kinase [Fulvivirgaceae bacterium BMA10]|uniref:Histidine kinase n=1 Tax=Splendidivirga corallicola TaxID=3051826 RepID=A0ABT8KWX0_9BACT|nr:histidine kinase [Fulvivirgaceae bacterium BMA10]